MTRRQAFQFQAMPNGAQERAMRRFAGCCRFVYNKALALQIERREQGEKHLSYFDMTKLLTAWRNDPKTPWLADAPAQPQQQALKNLQRAYANFFAGRAAFTRFKKKGRSSDSFRYPQAEAIHLEQHNSRIFLPKLGWIRYRKSREVLGTVKNATVSESCGKWYVSIQTEREVDLPVHAATTAVGIDMGVVRFATLSDGTVVEPLNSFKKHEDRLAKAQRSLSRKTKGSNNWKKAVAKVRKVHVRIANVRIDFLHKASTTISNNHAIVCIEDLRVANMSRSAAGTADKPGRNVKAKSGLNKAILDQGWFEFRRQLTYKLEWKGGQLIAVPPRHTSQTCPHCGCVSADNRKTQSLFRCLQCGFEENADLVGAMNVRRAGSARIACGVSTARESLAHEPTEANEEDSPFGAVGSDRRCRHGDHDPAYKKWTLDSITKTFPKTGGTP